jgi:NADPH:quinone reductase-like Zn-dependent oxidoreductase
MEADKQRQVVCRGGKFKMEGGAEVPKAEKGQALIRVHYSTVNPYDRICYDKQEEGFVLGCDGCGIVEAVGEGVSETLIGKKVAFLGGAWAKYTLKEADYLVQFPQTFDLKLAANTYVNPFTVTAMLDFSQKHGAKAVILTAASSQLSKMMIKLCKGHGIETVNIVHRDQ